MIETRISHIAIGLYQGNATAAVVVHPVTGTPQAGDRFDLAGRSWRVQAAVPSRPYDAAGDATDADGLIALVVADGDPLVADRAAFQGQTLTLRRDSHG